MSPNGGGGGDLDLLLSLSAGGDRVAETPPSSPSPSDGVIGTPPRRPGRVDMSAFRDAVKDYLDADEDEDEGDRSAAAAKKGKKRRRSDEVIVEKFSGLSIRSAVSAVEINNRFSDIRFVRLSAIKNLLSGDKLSGCWATVGVLYAKGAERATSQGKSYSIWKLGTLDNAEVSVFMFGDAYTSYRDEKLGSVFAFFNCNIRNDKTGTGFSLSVYSEVQMLKLGSSTDFGVCKGKTKNGLACTMGVNKRLGSFCKFHVANSSRMYTTGRVELKGGNLKTAFRRHEGIYMINSQAEHSKSKPVRTISVEGLKKALSGADKVTSNSRSQGIRFLAHVTDNPQQVKTGPAKRLIPSSAPNVAAVHKAAAKAGAAKKEQGLMRNANHPPEKTIELDICSSDDEQINFALRR